ncbi:hypothetical protein DL93DRAFT_2075226 [Clavulina sp. PMI_390]|nr:hypothetical protein DL93DRAFT_2075226 [Clavulina sp. PMI_390]
MNATYEPTTFLIDEERQKALAGGGGVTMSAKDAAVWLQSLLLNGRNPKTGEAVIPAQAIIRSKSGVVAAIPNPRSPELSVTVYGGAQAQFAYQGHNIIEHNGGWRGWWSMISRAPDDGLGIAVLTNWDDGAFVSEIVKWHLYEKAWGIPHIDWSSR